MISDVNVVYYRGLLRSCNYHCEYCPFSKTKMSKVQLEKDKQALLQFCEFVTNNSNINTIFFIPYGEALIHSYYLEQITYLSSLPHIKTIICQTNASFLLSNMLEKHPTLDTNKLQLWCTYHPTQVGFTTFMSQVTALDQIGIKLSVGMVGDVSNLSLIEKARQQLPIHIYLWINAMDGRLKPYTKSEIDFFTAIDPLFPLQLVRHKCNPTKCKAGSNHVLIKGNGNIYPCIRNTNCLGTINNNEALHPVKATNRSCDCYLTYSQRTDISSLSILKEGVIGRIPSKQYQAIFFDIDGTLLSDSLDFNEVINILHSIKCNIYLCTQRPLTSIKKHYPQLLEYINGGVFGNGSYLVIHDLKYKKIYPLSIDKDILPNVYSYKEDDICYKMITKQQITNEQTIEQYHVVTEQGITSITAKEATKYNGIITLLGQLCLNKEDVIVVGNSDNDVEMLRYFPNSIAVPNASEDTKSVASNIMSIKSLSMFI